LADSAALDAMRDELVVDMDAAMQFGIDASYPDPSKVSEDIYA
jgi:hypothetical protein